MEQYPETYQDEENIDLKKYLFRILYNWWWFALAIFISLTVAYLINRYSEDIYQARCSIIIGNDNTARNDVAMIIEEMTNLRTRQNRAIVQNEITILKSYKMARMAIDELDFGITYTAVGRRGIAETKMYNSSPFIVIPDTSKPNHAGYKVNVTILSPSKYRLSIDKQYNISEELYFGQKFEHENFNFTIVPRTAESIKNMQDFPKKYYFTMHNNNGLANRYRGMLNVEMNDERGSILTLSLSGPNSEQICDYLNKLSEIYIQYNLDEKNAASSNTIEFIDEQLSDIVDSLEIAGNQLQSFRTTNRVIDISREGNLLFEQMEELNAEKAGYDIQDRYFNYIKNYIESRKETSDIIAPSVMGISDVLLNSLVSQINELNMQRRTLEFSTIEGNPASNLIEMQLADAKQALLENVENLIETNNISLASLNERITEVEAEIQKLPATERQLINIERNFNINDQIYTFMLEKRAEAGITKASNTPDHRQLDIARMENASRIKPKTSMNYMMALVIGGLLPLLLIILIEYFNNKIVDRKDIENRTNIPILGSVGHNDKAFAIPVFESPKSSLAESFRALRTNLQYMLKNENKKVISISSAISGEGKTFIAANLATIIAMAGKKTLLLSLDLRRPKIHNLFKINNSEGLSSYLAGMIEREQVFHTTHINNLFVANAGPIPPNPAELIESKKMVQFITDMRKEYDYLVIDTPPVAIVTDAILLKEQVDMHIFVLRHGYSSRQVLEILDELYTKKDVKNMCLLVNDVQTKGYYGYNYRYSYGYGYGGYGYGYGYEHDYYDEKSRIEHFPKKLIRWLKITK